MSLNVRAIRQSLRRLSLGACLAFMAAQVAIPPAAAQRFDVPEHPVRPVVMELFSSQGCGNCPQANRNIAMFAKRTDVIALTYPVGYWDYLGWDDTFARPAFGERQTRYNRVLGHRGPYTPQVIYSGKLHGSGVNLEGIAKSFAVRDISPYPVKVTFDGGEVVVDGPAAAKAAEIVLVRFKPGATEVTPGAGANKGKAMTYHNLVTGYEMLGAYSGGEKRYRYSCEAGCVVMVQAGGSEGAVMGVAQKQ